MRITALALIVGAVILCGGCHTPKTDPPAPLRGVIVISVDTLRADRVGAFGGPADATPRFDALARESVVFTRAFAHAPSTLPSHASLFSSQTPDRHGAFFARRAPLDAGVTTIAECFRAAGWATAAFHNGAQMAPAFGLGQGFERYERTHRNRLAAVGNRGIDWIDALAPDQRFFLFLHTYHVHAPYEPEPGDVARFRDPGYDGRLADALSIKTLEGHNERGDLRPEDLAHVANLYQAGIRGMDRDLGLLLARLRARNQLDQILLVVLSDHGEELGERGSTGWHAHTLYDELLQVPLLIRFPGGHSAGSRIEGVVGLIDVAPTLLDLLAFPRPAGFAGESLLPLIADPRAPFREHVLAVRDEVGPEPLRAVRTAEWKLIGTSLYDLSNDPDELVDVAASHPEIVARLSALRDTPTDASTEEVAIDEELRSELEALGYL